MRDQAIILARMAAVLTARSNRWSLRLRDRNTVCVDGVCRDSSILCSRWVSGLVVENLFTSQYTQRVNARARPSSVFFVVVVFFLILHNDFRFRAPLKQLLSVDLNYGIRSLRQ